ncbi:class II fructose-bisphosphate aldolase [Oscillospiraceae bacterium LTW-04]|nr:class II fructose-bisphosphate aldolase [Oscillospiraceae bacterium MB24-C1]
MLSYQALGLENSKNLLKKAYEGHYAVGAFNFISIEQLNGIFDACVQKRSPVILLGSPKLCRQFEPRMLARMAQAGRERVLEQGLDIPTVLHLDHGLCYEHCVTAIQNGFSSVMIDGSALPFAENVALTRQIVEYAHAYGVTVEGELGVLDTEANAQSYFPQRLYTDPYQAAEFVEKTGVDSLAVSIGTSHGMVKYLPNPDGSYPELRYDILDKIETLMPGFPIVLHGASCLPYKYIEMINRYGGKIGHTAGIPDYQITNATQKAVSMVNIASDGWLAALALTRKVLAENPTAIDGRIYSLQVRPELKELYCHKIDILGSAGKC